MKTFKYKQLVKMIEDGEYYIVEGYNKRTIVHKGGELNEEIYQLKHAIYDYVVFRTKDKITYSGIKTADYLLDKYNDYIALYKIFGDKNYKEKAEKVLERMGNML